MNSSILISSEKKKQKGIIKLVKYGSILLIVGSIFYFFDLYSVNATELLKEKKDTFILNDTEYQKLYKTFDFRNNKKTSIPLKGIGKVLGSSNKTKISNIFEKTKDIKLEFPEKLKSIEIKPIIQLIPTIKKRKLFFIKGGAAGLLISLIVNSFNEKESFVTMDKKIIDEKEIDNSEVLSNKRTILKNKLKKIVPYLYNFRTPFPYFLIFGISGALMYFNREKIFSYIDILVLKIAHYLDLDFGPNEIDFDPDIELIKKYNERNQHPRWFITEKDSDTNNF